MLAVIQLDATAFAAHPSEFISLFFSVIGAERMTIEHKFISALFATPALLAHPLFDGVHALHLGNDLSQEDVFGTRIALLDSKSSAGIADAVLLANIGSAFATASRGEKPFLYRCVNDLVSGLHRCLKVSTVAPPADQQDLPEGLRKRAYQTTAEEIVRLVHSHLGTFVTPSIVPGLKSFPAAT